MAYSSPSNNAVAKEIQVNDAVYVERGSHQQLEGVVAFLGNVMFAAGDDWVGVRLSGVSVGLGKNDGSVQGVRYFSCGPQNGLFVRLAHVSPRSLSKLEELRLKRHRLHEITGSSGGSRSLPSTPARNNRDSTSPQLAAVPTSLPNVPQSNTYDDLLDEVLESEQSPHNIDMTTKWSPNSSLVHKEDRVKETSFRNETHPIPYTQQSLTEPLLAHDSDSLSPPPSLRRRQVQLHDERLVDNHAPETPSRRILDRDAAFHQSRGKWSVQRLSHGNVLGRAPSMRPRRCWRLCDDWFHNLAYKPTVLLMLILFLSYTSAVVFFAFVYRVVNILGTRHTTNFCGMDITNRMEALYFSLSTMTTIGYGVSDYYFGDCWTPLLLVLLQVCTAITFDAVAIGLLFLRMSRGRKRGKTIIFSDKAVIRRVRGCPHLLFRIGELRRNFIIEATVRVYCVRHERYPVQHQRDNQECSSSIETTHFVTRHVSLAHPDETTGSHLLMSIPQVIVHKMDLASPLTPPRPTWFDADGNQHNDSVKKYDSLARNEKQSLDRYKSEKDDIRKFHLDRDIEVVVLVEGTDEVTGSALQARHSYRPEDIVWDHTFAPCVVPCQPGDEEHDDEWFQERGCRRRVRQPACCIDFDMFHEIQKVSMNCDACPFVPQHS